MTAVYKRTKKGAGRTTKVISIGLDLDLLTVMDNISNKTRFINDAIREKIKREILRFEKKTVTLHPLLN